MHQALQISEILRTIFRWCDKPSNVSNAVVCKPWQNDALDLVWEEIPDIRHIFEFLGLFSTEQLDRPVTHEHWGLFRKRYAWRVHKIVCYNADWGQTPLLDTFARLQHFTPAFPNLKQLIWTVRLDSGDEYSHRSVVLMHPNVEQFDLSITHSDVASETLKQYMRAVSQYLPGLKRLSVTAPSGMDEGLTESLATLVADMPALESISLPGIFDPSSLLKALSSHSPSLKTLQFIRYHENSGVVQMSLLTPPSVLRDLQRLSIAVPYQTLAHFIRGSYESIPGLTSLSVSATSPRAENPSAVKDLLEVVGKELPTVKEVELTFNPEFFSNSDTQPENLTMADVVHFAHIEPIIACASVTRFRIAHPYPLAVHENDLERIASAWPNLQSLVLSEDPVYSEALQDNPEWPHLDLRVLLPFSRHCTSLEELRLSVRPGYVGDEQDILPFQRLTHFSPGGQWCEGGDEEILDVAIFLSQLLPPRCQVEFESRWLSEESRNKWDQSWNEVKKNRRCVEELGRRQGDSKRWRQLPKVEDKKDSH
ncbi:hypothetical protein AAF712_014392 [Marasmius tenuissimus]|uniref:F-box domain-containing protein n=1 Tax=Marasmius tenuissimus TaxID=585030 RepID=A0ABR2ZCC1_9AGAR